MIFEKALIIPMCPVNRGNGVTKDVALFEITTYNYLTVINSTKSKIETKTF